MGKSNAQAMMESNRTENKRELTDSLEKEIVAFLNYPEGGGSMGGSIELTDRQSEILLMVKKNNMIIHAKP